MPTKIEITIPDGHYCTGCMLDVVIVCNGYVQYGCEYLHKQCEAEGEYRNRAIKHPNCPSLAQARGEKS